MLRLGGPRAFGHGERHRSICSCARRRRFSHDSCTSLRSNLLCHRANTYALLSFAGYFQGEEDPANDSSSSVSPDLSTTRLTGANIVRIKKKLNAMPDVAGDRSEEEYNAELKGTIMRFVDSLPSCHVSAMHFKKRCVFYF